MPHVPQPNKIIVETEPIGPWFKGEPTEHVHNFVREVEAIMAAKGITDDIEKINFIKARIRGDATTIISGSSFSKRYVGDIYSNYRQALLTSFGKGKHAGQLAWMSRALDVGMSKARSLDMGTSSAVAGQLYNDIIDTLGNAAPLPNHPAWPIQGSIYSIGELFEYFLFLLMLKPEDYRAAKTVERKSGEQFINVKGRIEAKMIPHITPYALSVPSEGATAQIPVASTTVPKTGIQPVSKQHVTKGSYKATLEVKYCRECKKHGHTWERCYFNENREERTRKPTSRPESSTNKNFPQRNTNQAKQGGSGKWCDLHEVTTHNTWQCRTLMKTARDTLTHRQNKSSGEDWDRQRQNPA
ncbi:hypothetical protein Pmani_013892 [Petrolisthes manimaculis]|uniref:Uncharacterized protein n=1 Tax=Petrolisthes manimaculis TaxID=1843537 RepID=A0AAE1U8X9_9EUCA|nr:hypothetical protein Pmani_013892 [Petrolisthes manimaculis]